VVEHVIAPNVIANVARMIIGSFMVRSGYWFEFLFQVDAAMSVGHNYGEATATCITS
jgi:hypothetical protein